MINPWWRLLTALDAVPKKRGPKTEVLEELLKRIDGLEKRLGENDGAASGESPGRSSTSSVPSRKRSRTDPMDREPNNISNPSPPVDMPPPLLSPDDRLIPQLVDVFFERVNGKPYTLFHEGIFRQSWAAGRVPNYVLNTLFAVSVRWVGGTGRRGTHW